MQIWKCLNSQNWYTKCNFVIAVKGPKNTGTHMSICLGLTALVVINSTCVAEPMPNQYGQVKKCVFECQLQIDLTP